MNIIVLGAGAIGSLYGAKLSKLNDVILIAKKQHADKINKNGLKVVGLENKVYKLNAVTKVERIERGTLILLTTKVYDSKKAVNTIKNLIKKDTIILCLQNGLYSEEIAKKIAGAKCLVLRGITTFGAIFLSPGISHYQNNGYTAIEKSSRSDEIAENFKKCGLNGHVSKNMKKDMWKKLLLNCVLNPLTAILRIENRGIADKRLDPLKKLIVEECLKAAKKDGIKFDIDFLKTINESVRNSKNISSMQQDLMKGKQTEVEYLNGAVVGLCKKYGIKCPVNESLIAIIKSLEKQ